MKYRKKPVVVEAEPFWPTGLPWPAGVEETADPASPTGYVIDTLEGRMEVTPGDFIITGVAGERYPCKPEIFAATYEPVDEPITVEATKQDTTPDHPRCGTCGYFSPDVTVLSPDSPRPYCGECRHHEPVLCFEAERHEYGYWPRVYGADWCGEHTRLQQRTELVSDAGESFPYRVDIISGRKDGKP